MKGGLSRTGASLEAPVDSEIAATTAVRSHRMRAPIRANGRRGRSVFRGFVKITATRQSTAFTPSTTLSTMLSASATISVTTIGFEKSPCGSFRTGCTASLPPLPRPPE
jgi:hypothetical protein